MVKLRTLEEQGMSDKARGIENGNDNNNECRIILFYTVRMVN